MDRIELKLSCYDKSFLEVKAFTDGSGLAVNKERNREKEVISGKWQITHIVSGLYIGASYSSKKKAIEALTKLIKLPIDWKQSQDKIAGRGNGVLVRDTLGKDYYA